MSTAELGRMMISVFSEYKNQIEFYFVKGEDIYYSHIKERQVVMSLINWVTPTEWSAFAFLHEVGHVVTNTTKMKRYEQEFLATQWAIDKAKEFGFKVSKSTQNTYQNYIWDWRDRSIKLKGKNVASRNSLKLNWY